MKNLVKRMDRYSEFDDIRSFRDEEVSAVIDELLQDRKFREVATMLIPGAKSDWEGLAARMRGFRSVFDFQILTKEIGLAIAERSARELDAEGFENILKNTPYTFVTNHRDIVLDATFLSILLNLNGYETTEIAIGDNLLLQPWIEKTVRLNKSFIVKRNVSFRQILEVSKHLSRYIHYAIGEKRESVWIAQREGRAKDSDDRTQISLLKMLAMGGEGGFLGNLKELNICPVTFSYEYDPCDYLKAKEFQQKRDIPDFRKTRRDDYLNMETGIFGYKGNIHLQFGRPLNGLIREGEENAEKGEQVQRIATLIDTEIFRNYRFYPINYIAYDRLWGKNRFADLYSEENISAFNVYLQKQLDKIDLRNPDLPFLTEKILEMYANPVKNYLSVTE